MTTFLKRSLEITILAFLYFIIRFIIIDRFDIAVFILILLNSLLFARYNIWKQIQEHMEDKEWREGIKNGISGKSLTVIAKDQFINDNHPEFYGTIVDYKEEEFKISIDVIKSIEPGTFKKFTGVYIHYNDGGFIFTDKPIKVNHFDTKKNPRVSDPGCI